MNELTPEEAHRIEQRWKSDVDLKLDKLVAFSATYEPVLKLMMVREEQQSALRRSIIEKSLVALIWAFIGFIGTSIYYYLRALFK